MQTYAQVIDGVVTEIVTPMVYGIDAPPSYDDQGNLLAPAYLATDEVPIALRFPPEFVATLVDITNIPGIVQGMTYDGTNFAAPVVPPPSAAEILAANTAEQSTLIATATTKIAVLTDATDPDIVDTVDPADVAALKAWKQYRVAVSKVDLTAESPVWPVAPVN